MASVGPNYPTQVSDYGNSWLNPTNVFAADGAYAQATAVVTSALRTYGYGFPTLPAGSTINGFVVEVLAYASATTSLYAYLFNDSTFAIKSNHKVVNIRTTAQWYTFGSSTDTWRSTISDVSGTYFGVAIFGSDPDNKLKTFSIDAVRVTVYYTPPQTLTRTDTATTTLGETITVKASLSSAETLSVSITDVFTGTMSFASSDASAVQLSEASSLVLPPADMTTTTLTESALVAQSKSVQDALAVSSTELPSVVLVVSGDAPALSLADLLATQANLGSADSSTVSLTDTSAVLVSLAETEILTVSETSAVSPTSSEAVTLSLADQSMLALQRSEVVSLSLTEARTLASYRGELGGLRVDAGPPQGEPFVSVFPVLACRLTWELNDVGSFSLSVPATAPGADQLDAGQEVRIIREGEGEIFRGIVSSRRVVLDGDNLVVELEGFSTAREISWRSTQLNWRVQGQRLDASVAALLAGTGWTSTADPAVAGQLVSAEFQGVTRFEAAKALAQQAFAYLRPMPVERRLDVNQGGRATGLRAVLVPAPVTDVAADTLLITRLRVSRRDEDIVTRVIPVGSGEGPNQLTLRWSTRTTPYPIQTMTGPDGSTLYYLEDSAAVATYGVREKVVVFKDVVPLANSATELQRAANVLYDLAAAWLQSHATPRVEWEADVGGPLRMRDPITGAWLVLPGDMIRLIARGVIEDWDGRRTLVDLDTPAFIRGIERDFEGDAESVRLTLTDTARVVRDDDLLADVINRLWAQSVAQKVVPAPEIHGPFRQSADSSNPLRLVVDWDLNVRFLHRAILVIVCRKVRSNVQTAASGGGTTQTTSSGGGTTQTTSSGGGTTQTSAGGSGSITVTATGGAHTHTLGTTQNMQAWATPPYMEQVVWANSSAGTNYGVYVGRGNTTPTNAQLYGTQDGGHTHDISAFLQNHTHSVTIPNHQHSVTIPDHQHSVTIPAHTHGLVYGIYESPYPSGLQVSVVVNGTNVTAALGGPWSPAESTPLKLDVTAFLQEADGRPKQQTNTIEIRVNALVDVEVVLKSFVAVATLVPVGVS